MMLPRKIRWLTFLVGASVMAMAGTALADDLFSNWAEMLASGCYAEGEEGDYEIYTYQRPSPPPGSDAIFENNLVLAIHGGTVEPGTDELAAEVAFANPIWCGRFCWWIYRSRLYQMIGHVDESDSCDLGNGPFSQDSQDLHIKAKNFDEPQAKAMVDEAFTIVSIHGMQDERYGGSSNMAICVGGENQDMINYFVNDVNSDPLLAGWMDVVDATESGSGCPEELDGDESTNIVNEGPNPDGGLQLELTKTLREELFAPGNEDKLDRLVELIQTVMYLESLQAPLP